MTKEEVFACLVYKCDLVEMSKNIYRTKRGMNCLDSGLSVNSDRIAKVSCNQDWYCIEFFGYSPSQKENRQCSISKKSLSGVLSEVITRQPKLSILVFSEEAYMAASKGYCGPMSLHDFIWSGVHKPEISDRGRWIPVTEKWPDAEKYETVFVKRAGGSYEVKVAVTQLEGWDHGAKNLFWTPVPLPGENLPPFPGGK